MGQFCVIELNAESGANVESVWSGRSITGRVFKGLYEKDYTTVLAALRSLPLVRVSYGRLFQGYLKTFLVSKVEESLGVSPGVVHRVVGVFGFSEVFKIFRGVSHEPLIEGT